MVLCVIMGIGLISVNLNQGDSPAASTNIETLDIDYLLAELFWIAVFTLTAKAALSISYNNSEKDVNPVLCKSMCLVGFIYSSLIDRSLFAYSFGPIQMTLAAGIALLTSLMLYIHANRYQDTNDREELIETIERRLNNKHRSA